MPIHVISPSLSRKGISRLHITDSKIVAGQKVSTRCGITIAANEFRWQDARAEFGGTGRSGFDPRRAEHYLTAQNRSYCFRCGSPAAHRETALAQYTRQLAETPAEEQTPGAVA